jgi:bifunctional non-homologous end joining protein LigD
MVRSASETLGFIKPELPTLVPEPHSGEGWIHEIKHDGYRTLIVIDQGKVRAFSRHGRDWTGPYRRVVEAASKLSCKAALIDGEIIVQDENGPLTLMPSCHLHSAAPDRVLCLRRLQLNGQDLRGHPLTERHALLRKPVKPDAAAE